MSRLWSCVAFIESCEEGAGAASAVGRAGVDRGAAREGWGVRAAPREVGVSRTTGANWARGYKTHRPGEVIGFVAVNADRKWALGAGRWFGPSCSSPTTRRTSPLGPGRQSPSDTEPWPGGGRRPRPHHPRGPGGLRDPPSADLAAGPTVSLATGLTHANWQAAVGVRRSRACGQSAARRMVRCPGRGADVRLVATTQSDRQSRRGRGHCRRWLRLLGCRQQTLDGRVAIRGRRDRAGGGRRREEQILLSRLLSSLAAVEGAILVLAATAPRRASSTAAGTHGRFSPGRRLVRPCLPRRRRHGAGRRPCSGDDRWPARLARLPEVLDGELAAVLLAAVTAMVIAVLRPAQHGREIRVPLGPAMIAVTLLICWL